MADGNLVVETDAETGDIVYYTPEQKKVPRERRGGHFANLAYELDLSDLAAVAATLYDLVIDDEEAQSSWAEEAADRWKLLGVGHKRDAQIVEEGEDNSDHPLLLTALTRFQSKALSALMPSPTKVCRAEAIEDVFQIADPQQRDQRKEDLEQAADRVEDFYADYLLDVLPNYTGDTDQILYDCGLEGLGIRKIVTDRTRRRTPVMPEYTALDSIILSYNTRNFRLGRFAHRIDMDVNDIVRRMQSGAYRPVDIGMGTDPDKGPLTAARDESLGLDNVHFMGTDTHRVYEVYCDLILNADLHPSSLARPYIVTLHKDTREVMSIVRNWRPDDIDETPIEHFVGYVFHPGKGLRAMGLGHILGNITRALRDAQRRGLEAAYFQNHPSGFKLASFTIRDEAEPIGNGQFKAVDAPVNDIRAALMMHPFEGPSPGLIQLAQHLEQNGKELGGIASIDFAQLMKAGVTAGPALAAYEESAEFQTAVHRRLYDGHRAELTLIHERMREIVGNTEITYKNGRKKLMPGDLAVVDLLPQMPPGFVSRQKQILQAAAIFELSGQAPDVINRRRAVEEYLHTFNRPDIDEFIIPERQEVQPADPASEYAALLQGQPVRAGVMQNHQAHIEAHTVQLKLLQASSLPTDSGDAVAAALTAHIAEHMGQDQIVQVSSRLGIPVQQFGQLPPQVEAQVAPRIAAAITQLEEQRRPQEESRAEIEWAKILAKGEVDARLAEIEAANEQRLETMKAAFERRLQEMKDEAAAAREEADNEAAILIAEMKANTGKDAGTRAATGAGAGANADATP